MYEREFYWQRVVPLLKYQSSCIFFMLLYFYSRKKVYTVKLVYNGHSKEPENKAFMSSCPLYTG